PTSTRPSTTASSSARSSCSTIPTTQLSRTTTASRKSTRRYAIDRPHRHGRKKASGGNHDVSFRTHASGHGSRGGAVVAERMVEDHGYQDRDHPAPDLHHPARTARGLHLHRRHQGRSLHHDRRARDRRL